MNTRRPTDAAGHSRRKFVDEQPPQPLDSDPLHVDADQLLAWANAFNEGYERGAYDSGAYDSSRPAVVVVLVLVGITAALLGGMVGGAVGMGLR